MEIALLLIRMGLACILAVAGVAKLADLDSARRSLAEFGVPALPARWLAYALPIVEIAIAASLLPSATAWWGALVAVILLLVFIVVIGYNLARGRTPACHCFGRLSSAPAGWNTILRNAALT